MITVFVSHSSLDDERVRSAIVEPLEQRHLKVWYSRDAIHGAAEWEKRIRHALTSTEWFVVALSANSLASDWVRAEVDWAIENRPARVVPVLIDDCRPEECHLRLRQIQYIDLRASNPAGVAQLLAVLSVTPQTDTRKDQSPLVKLRRYLARPRRLVLTAGVVVAVLLLAVMAWCVAAATRGPSPVVVGTPRLSTEGSAPLPPKGWIDVRVWDGAKTRNQRVLATAVASAQGMCVDSSGVGPIGGLMPFLTIRPERPNPERRRLYLYQHEALPMKVYDQVQVEAELPHPMFAYVIWIDSSGRALPVYPWRNFEWDQRSGAEQPVAQLKLPEGAAEDGWEMDEGAAGMETLLLLARESKLSAEGEKELRAALGALGPQALQDGKTDAAVWFENGVVVTAEAGRAPMSFDAKRIDDPVLRTQGLLRDKLVSQFGYTRAVSFAFRGK